MQQVIRTDATNPARPDHAAGSLAVRLCAIHERAEAINLPFRDLCERAKLVVSTVYRWKAGTNVPSFYQGNQAIKALDEALVAEEERLRKVLAT